MGKLYKDGWTDLNNLYVIRRASAQATMRCLLGVAM